MSEQRQEQLLKEVTEILEDQTEILADIRSTTDAAREFFEQMALDFQEQVNMQKDAALFARSGDKKNKKDREKLHMKDLARGDLLSAIFGVSTSIGILGLSLLALAKASTSWASILDPEQYKDLDKNFTDTVSGIGGAVLFLENFGNKAKDLLFGLYKIILWPVRMLFKLTKAFGGLISNWNNIFRFTMRNLGGPVGRAIDNFFGMFTDLGKFLSGKAKTVFSKVPKLLKAAFNTFDRIMTNITKFNPTRLFGIFRWLGRVFKWVAIADGVFKSILSGIKAFQETDGSIMDKLGAALMAALKTAFKYLINMIWQTFKDLTWVGKFFLKLKDRFLTMMKNFLSKFGLGWISDILKIFLLPIDFIIKAADFLISIVENFGSIMKNIKNALDNPLDALWQFGKTIATRFEGIIDASRNLFDGLRKGIHNVMKTVAKWFGKEIPEWVESSPALDGQENARKAINEELMRNNYWGEKQITSLDQINLGMAKASRLQYERDLRMQKILEEQLEEQRKKKQAASSVNVMTGVQSTTNNMSSTQNLLGDMSSDNEWSDTEKVLSLFGI